MTEFYNIPTTTLGAGGMNIDLGVGGVPYIPGREVYITIVESAGVAYTVQVEDRNGSYTAPLPVQASQPFQLKKVPNVRFVNLAGSGAEITGKITDYEVNPDSIVVSAPLTITGTVDTNIKQVAGASPNLAKETGGNLDGIATDSAEIQTSTAALASTVGTAPTSNKVTTQT